MAGENVYPKEVEDILLQHPNLRDACVVPAPHDVKGEVPIAFVVAREPGRTTEEDVRRFFLDRGAPYAHPRKVVFLDALPLGGTGKIDTSGSMRRENRLELVKEEKGRVEIRMPFREEFIRADGSDWLHGGVVSALVDIVGD